MGMPNPKVGLMNIGEEEGKGNILAQATYPLLKELKGINFIGNIEGRDVFYDKAEVIVCEGFVGNVIIKMAESVYDIFKVQRGVQDEFLDTFNFEQYGGTPVLGINKPVIIGHGISHAVAFRNKIELAGKFISSDIIATFKEKFKQA
jgi:glycerol-3-phosphate acyltransferase PlsX